MPLELLELNCLAVYCYVSFIENSNASHFDSITDHTLNYRTLTHNKTHKRHLNRTKSPIQSQKKWLRIIGKWSNRFGIRNWMKQTAENEKKKIKSLPNSVYTTTQRMSKPILSIWCSIQRHTQNENIVHCVWRERTCAHAFAYKIEVKWLKAKPEKKTLLLQ